MKTRVGTRRSLMAGQTPRPVLITGGGGAGGSALIAYWFVTGRTPVTRFSVEYSLDGLTWTFSQYVNATNLGNYSAIIGGLLTGTLYYFRVVPFNGFVAGVGSVGVGYTLHPDVDAWLDEVITLDGSMLLGYPEIWALNEGVITLDSNFYWQLLDRLWVYSPNSFNACRVCVKSLNTWTDTYNIETNGYGSGYGMYFPDGIYIDTGYNPSTDFAGADDEFCMGYYSPGNYFGVGLGDYGVVGAHTATLECTTIYEQGTMFDQYLRATAHDKNNELESNSYSKVGAKAVVADAGSGNIILYDGDGTPLQVASFTASSLPTATIYVGAVHIGGGSVTKKNLETTYVGGVFFGTGFDSGAVSKINELYAAYGSAVGW